MKLVFTWIQWSWKGTQARILAEKHGFKVLEMGTEFRKVISSGTELWEAIKEIVNKWEQVPESLWKQVMENALLENNYDDIIYDGFIRNEWNLELFDELISDYKVVLFDLDVEIAKERLLWRVYDKQTWETFRFGTKYNPKTGNTLIKREDDKNEVAILKRIEEFIEKTLPIIEKQKKRWLVIEINANQDIDAVSKELEEKLNL